MEFTKDELDVLAAALDMLARSEGAALQQAGLSGLKGGRVHLLTSRFTHAVSALEKIETYAAGMKAAETPSG